MTGFLTSFATNILFRRKIVMSLLSQAQSGAYA